MKEQIQNRLQTLQSEYQKGQKRLADLEQEIMELKSSMLRISGAIQVLQELQSDISEIKENLEPTNNHTKMVESDMP